jgi:sec-independent protein translocase protein TatB
MHFGDSIFIFVLALVLFGPKRLPEIGRQIGKLMAEFRRASNDFKLQIEDELRAAEQQERQQQIAAQTQPPPYVSGELTSGTSSEPTIKPPSIGETVSTASSLGASPYPDEPPPPDRQYYPPYPSDATPETPQGLADLPEVESSAVSDSAPNVEEVPTVVDQIAASEIAEAELATTDIAASDTVPSVEQAASESPYPPQAVEASHLNGGNSEDAVAYTSNGSSSGTNGAPAENERASTHHD